jgi:hypothetical protein
MALLVPNGSEVIALSYLVGKTTTTEPLVLRLYSSNTTPAETDTVGTYTELVGGGYASIALTGATWTVVAGNPTTASYPQQTWTFTGAAPTVYGYYLTRATSADLVYAERFSDGPYGIANNGDAIKVTPSISAE